MKLFRIYCGLDTNGNLHPELARQTAERLALKFFPHGHTIYEATGRWQSETVAVSEDTMIIEVLLDERTGAQAKVYELAGAYKERCYQESVMITEATVEASFV